MASTRLRYRALVLCLGSHLALCKWRTRKVAPLCELFKIVLRFQVDPIGEKMLPCNLGIKTLSKVVSHDGRSQ